MKRGGNKARGTRPIIFASRVCKLTEQFLPKNRPKNGASRDSWWPGSLRRLLRISDLRVFAPARFFQILHAEIAQRVRVWYLQWFRACVRFERGGGIRSTQGRHADSSCLPGKRKPSS